MIELLEPAKVIAFLVIVIGAIYLWKERKIADSNRN